jgi:hypothetical protein
LVHRGNIARISLTQAKVELGLTLERVACVHSKHRAIP